jgi:hypothetical protein
MKPIIIENRFSPQAKALRKHFENNFAVHKDIRSERFVWDYWYVKDQYQFLRTPAYHYFPSTIYQKFHSQLVQWGREVLGCHDVSPPWLSYYVEGMEQKIHSDVPHGPWAWVYSLTLQTKKFDGGETFILKPETLNYWQNFVDEKEREQKAYVENIAPDFNRLIVFDPRLPHGVTPVRGTADPLQGRVVIHGWFVEPRPYVVGGLSTALVQKGLQPALIEMSQVLNQLQNFHGTMSFRLSVAASGEVTKFQWLTDTIVSLAHNETETMQLKNWIRSRFSNTEFRKTSSPSKITVPLLFR